MPTATELLTQVRDMLDEPTAAQWTDDMLTRWINEAGRDLARATRHLKDSEDVVVTGGVSEYVLPNHIIAVEHCYFLPGNGDERQIPLMARHWEGMDQVWGSWQNRETSYPVFFTVIGYSPSATLKLYPTPAEDADLKLITARIPGELSIPSVGGETADLPEIWYDAAVSYCEMKGLRRDRDERWQEAYQMYQEKRDGLTHNPDFLAVNREVVPTPGGQYMDRWLVEFDGYGDSWY